MMAVLGVGAPLHRSTALSWAQASPRSTVSGTADSRGSDSGDSQLAAAEGERGITPAKRAWGRRPHALTVASPAGTTENPLHLQGTRRRSERRLPHFRLNCQPSGPSGPARQQPVPNLDVQEVKTARCSQSGPVHAMAGNPRRASGYTAHPSMKTAWRPLRGNHMVVW
jgi:hypothetical protein